MSASSDSNYLQPPVRKYNQRMAQRVARRAHVNEQGVAVCFAFNNLLTSLLIGVVEDVARVIQAIGSAIDLATGTLPFHSHPIVRMPIATSIAEPIAGMNRATSSTTPMS